MAARAKDLIPRGDESSARETPKWTPLREAIVPNHSRFVGRGGRATREAVIKAFSLACPPARLDMGRDKREAEKDAPAVRVRQGPRQGVRSFAGSFVPLSSRPLVPKPPSHNRALPRSPLALRAPCPLAPLLQQPLTHWPHCSNTPMPSPFS